MSENLIDFRLMDNRATTKMIFDYFDIRYKVHYLLKWSCFTLQLIEYLGTKQIMD